MCICQATATEPEISLWTSALRQGKLSTTRWAKSDDRSGPGRTIKLTLDGKLTIAPVSVPPGTNFTGLTLRVILSDASGNQLVFDVVHYRGSGYL
jgi:hypothetical protein